mmetsp:Transcript_40712/g.97676  ORF Transcript_40712/g.97676 Transcript_40712/m.97676 type:complete len:214 (+) Transcript_40712:319-960(+)
MRESHHALQPLRLGQRVQRVQARLPRFHLWINATTEMIEGLHDLARLGGLHLVLPGLQGSLDKFGLRLLHEFAQRLAPSFFLEQRLQKRHLVVIHQAPQRHKSIRHLLPEERRELIQVRVVAGIKILVDVKHPVALSEHPLQVLHVLLVQRVLAVGADDVEGPGYGGFQLVECGALGGALPVLEEKLHVRGVVPGGGNLHLSSPDARSNYQIE